MFLFRLMSFVFGHVSLIVQGEALEKFINMAAGRGIYLWNVSKKGTNKMIVSVRISSVKPLRHIAKATNSSFKVHTRSGVPFLINKMKKRKVLVGGSLIFLLALYFLSSFIWFVEVSGNVRLSNGEILKIASQAGLSRGAYTGHVDTDAVEQALKDKDPLISWTGVEIKGTKAFIEIVEKKVPEGVESTQPADIVAKKDGLIKEILVLAGQPMVKEGDTVQAGQILVRGEIIPEAENPIPQEISRFVRAKGVVRARVWYEGYGESLLLEKGKKPSGRVSEQVSMKILGKEIILRGTNTPPFKQYRVESKVKKPLQWRNIDLLVEINTIKYIEMKNYSKSHTRLQACQLAEKKAMQFVKGKLSPQTKVMEERVERVETGQEEKLVRVKVFVEALEEIGSLKPFQP